MPGENGDRNAPVLRSSFGAFFSIFYFLNFLHTKFDNTQSCSFESYRSNKTDRQTVGRKPENTWVGVDWLVGKNPVYWKFSSNFHPIRKKSTKLIPFKQHTQNNLSEILQMLLFCFERGKYAQHSPDVVSRYLKRNRTRSTVRSSIYGKTCPKGAYFYFRPRVFLFLFVCDVSTNASKSLNKFGSFLNS